MTKLDKAFFERSTDLVARELLGKVFCHATGNELLAGRIVETEAYMGYDDAACHSAVGKTKRNAAMFGSAGRHYLYISYGIHLCYNVTTDNIDIPAAVLLRALQPLSGLETMRILRPKAASDYKLLAGPGNLCRGMALNMSYNDTSATSNELYFIDDGYKVSEQDVVTTTRIGISKGTELPLRFYLKDNKYISKK